MIEFIKQDSNKNIILFVHGFIGGRKTWISDDKSLRLLDYLISEEQIRENYDFALFNYFSKLTDKLEKVKWVWKIFNGGKKLKKNLSIEDLADLLYSQIQINLKNYEKIIIIAHSMGGLVSKACIIKSIERKSNTNISSYFSLAVPHNGSNLANLGKAILNNPHVKDLAPLEEFINNINVKWLSLDNLPKTTYYQGKADEIVPKTSSIGYDKRQIEPVFSDDDHFSILRPENKYSVVLKSIIDTILTVETNKKMTKSENQNNLSTKGDNFSNITNSTIINKSNFRNR